MSLELERNGGFCNYLRRMAGLFSITSRRFLAFTVAVLLLLGFIPLGTGLALISTPQHAELSLDLCHPLQSFETAQTAPMARPSLPAVAFVRLELGATPELTAAKFLRFISPPETPPPESVA